MSQLVPSYPIVHKFELHFYLLVLTFALAVQLCACGGAAGVRNPGAMAPVSAPIPQFSHVVLVVEENHSYSQVVDNSAMPFLNQLAKDNSVATQYFANAHPSLSNYFMLTTGQLITMDDSFPGPVADDNIVRELISAGKTWKSYAESVPAAGYTGNDRYP